MKFFVTLVLLLLSLSQISLSWGPDGHQMVGQIAANYVTATAMQNMQPFLNGFTLANISTWPDLYRETPQGAWSEDLHFVNLPLNAREFQIKYCAPELTGGVGCVVTAIANYTHILYEQIAANKPVKCVNQSTEGVEPCALSFLTHFVGDIHQPLHISYAVDEGGNLVLVEFNNECTNLHAVWDFSLISFYENATNLDWYGLAQLLTHEVSVFDYSASNWSMVLTPNHWANESYEITRVRPYNFQPGYESPRSDWVHTPFPDIEEEPGLLERLTPRPPRSGSSCSSSYYQLRIGYYTRNIPLVFEQLMKAGVRLATRLNTIFDPTFVPPLQIIPYQAYYEF